MPTTEQVIQADREAAISLYKLWGYDETCVHIAEGRCDTDEIVQAFARHRLSHLPQGEGEVRARFERAMSDARAANPFEPFSDEAGIWNDAFSDAWATARAALSPHPVSCREDVLEEAAALVELTAKQTADLVFEASEAGLSETARNREAMEAMATRIVAQIRALKSSTPSVSEEAEPGGHLRGEGEGR